MSMICPNCDKEIEEDIEQCPFCGCRFPMSAKRKQEEERLERERKEREERARQEQLQKERERQERLRRIEEEKKAEIERKKREQIEEQRRRQQQEKRRREEQERMWREEQERMRRERQEQQMREEQERIRRERQEQQMREEQERRWREEQERMRIEEQKRLQGMDDENRNVVHPPIGDAVVELKVWPANEALNTNVCPQCGKPLRQGAMFCKWCGSSIQPQKAENEQSLPPEGNQPVQTENVQLEEVPVQGYMARPDIRICPRCGKEINIKARFCNRCGFQMD